MLSTSRFPFPSLEAEAKHDCDFTRTSRSCWCSGPEEYILLDGDYVHAPWDQKHLNEIAEALIMEMIF